ncbi:MAG TPA: hypothetical protein VFA39_19995 [Steroidobacteraceae bacterium]|nr:hypothetical protein [Steroidobacteraceae bacterium]
MTDSKSNTTSSAGGDAGASPLGPRDILNILGCVLADIRGIASHDPAYFGGPRRLDGVSRLEAIAVLTEASGHLHALTVQPLTEFGLLEAAVTVYRAAPIWADPKCYRTMGLALEQMAVDTAQAERGEKGPRGSILQSSLVVQ